MTTVIDEVRRSVEAACAGENNIFGYGIWTHHITLVAEVGRRLAKQMEADPEIVELAALLHDYAGIKDERLIKEHHLHSQVEAERILTGLGYPVDKIEAVKHCIATHRGSVPSERRTPEAECLANADAISHLEQIPSLLHLAFVRRSLSVEEGTTWVRNKLARTWNKLSPEVQEMMQDKYEAALVTLTVKEPDA